MNNNDRITLTTRVLQAHGGILGITSYGDSTELFGGYDTQIHEACHPDDADLYGLDPKDCLTNEERQEIALRMIARWANWVGF